MGGGGEGEASATSQYQMAQSLGKSTFGEILAKMSFTQNFTRMYLELLQAKVEADQMSIDRATVDNVKAGHVGENLQNTNSCIIKRRIVTEAFNYNKSCRKPLYV